MMNVYYFHHQADELLGTASEQFLGKSVSEIKQTILQTLEGHLRAILGKRMRVCLCAREWRQIWRDAKIRDAKEITRDCNAEQSCVKCVCAM